MKRGSGLKTIIITVGNEITSGHTINTNAAWLASAIETVGITPDRVLTLRDDVGALVKEIRSATKKYNLVLVTGGLGPTHDDVTKPALVKAFDTKLVRNEKILRAVKKRFKKWGAPMPPVNEGQADVPEICQAVPSKFGTAPLLFFDTGACLLFALPGVPYEMRMLTQTEIIPRLKKLAPKSAIERRVVRTVGISESALYTKVERSVTLEKDIELAWLPHYGQVDIRLTAHKPTAGSAKKALKRAMKELNDIIGENVFACDDTTLEQAVGTDMRARGLTLACAESCSGGLFASGITSAPGASEYFLEGVVAYSNSAKIKRLGVKKSTLAKHGAVSARTAGEMASGARKSSGAHIGISSTGIAGPTGGSKDKPVGRVYIGISYANKLETHKFDFGQDRERNQLMTAQRMLCLLWGVVRKL